MKKQIEFFSCIFIVDRFYQERIQRNAMYRQIEDIEEIARLDERCEYLANENRELKKKLERKRYKIQGLKEEVDGLTKALAQAQQGGLGAATTSPPDYENCKWKEYEKRQQELQHAALQKVQLAPFCNPERIKEESSIPFDDIGERIIVRDGKKIKQWILDYRWSEDGEENHLYQEREMTKWELEEMEKEEEEKRIAEAEKQHVQDQIRIGEEEPSIPYDENNERIISRNGKTYKQWFQCGFGTHIWYGEKEFVHLDEQEKELDEWIEKQEEKARLGFGRFDVSGRLRLD
jgi:hypothetical protein